MKLAFPPIQASPSLAHVRPFASIDVAATRRTVGDFINEHKLICENGGLNATLQQCTVGSISIMRLKYGTPVRIEPQRRNGFYIAQVATRGRARVHFPNTSFELDASLGALFCPIAPVWIDLSSQCEQYILKVPAVTLHQTAHVVLEDSWKQLPQFEQPRMLTGPDVRSLVGLIEHIILQQPYWQTRRSHERFARDAEELLAGCLVLSGNRFSVSTSTAEHGGIVSRYAQEAEGYMRANLSRPLSLSQIARSIGVSIRTLHNAFRAVHGASPMAVLLNWRLAAARDDLLSAPAGTHVGDVARRWGFPHHGRFTSAYRRKFGEHPSRTARNRRVR